LGAGGSADEALNAVARPGQISAQRAPDQTRGAADDDALRAVLLKTAMAGQVLTGHAVAMEEDVSQGFSNVGSAEPSADRSNGDPVPDMVPHPASVRSFRDELMPMAPVGKGARDLFIDKSAGRFIEAVVCNPPEPDRTFTDEEYRSVTFPDAAGSFEDLDAGPRGIEPLERSGAFMPGEHLRGGYVQSTFGRQL
jgi:hypothetical protein